MDTYFKDQALYMKNIKLAEIVNGQIRYCVSELTEEVKEQIVTIIKKNFGG